MRITTACVAVLLASGFAAAQTPGFDRRPDDKQFELGGQRYRWGVAHGVTGSVMLTRQSEQQSLPPGMVTRWDVEIVLTCSGVASGGLQTRMFAPTNAPQIRLMTGDVVFRVRSMPEEQAGRTFVKGQGDLPTGLFAALASAETVAVEYGSETLTIPGPGAPLAEHFQRYCETLAVRAAKDEVAG